MSTCHGVVTSRIRRLMASAALACGVALAGSAGRAVAQTDTQATPDHERLPLLHLLVEGLARAGERIDLGGGEGHLSLSSRDTLYLYDLVHGNVKVIATSPNGGLVRRRAALRLLAVELVRTRSRLEHLGPPRSRLPS